MQTIDFLRDILPSRGWYYASRLVHTVDAKGNRIRIWANDPFDTVDALAASILHYDGIGVDTYYAMAGYNQASYQKTSPRGHVRTKTRTQENAEFVKSFWVDLDCGPSKPYATQREAFAAIKPHFAAGLPRPTHIVSSGYGLHLYWVLTRDLDVESWTRVATTFKQVIIHLGIQSDAQVIADSARVLRPAGTHNYKDPQSPQAVVVLPTKSNPYYHVKDFAFAIFRMARSAGLDRVAQRRTASSGLHTLAGRIMHRDYQPFSAQAMADQCPAFKEMRDTQGRYQSYPQWLCSVQTLIHTQECAEDNNDLIHEWSAGYPDYDAGYVEEKIDHVRDDGMRPVRCETMALHSGACATCHHRGKINSPVRLGWQTAGHVTEAPTIVEPEVPGMRVKQFSVPPLPGAFAGRFRWDGSNLLGTRVKYNKRGEEEHRWEVPITPFFFMVDFLYRQDDKVDGEMIFRISVRVRQGEWDSADIPVGSLAAGGSIAMREIGKAFGVVTPRNVDLLEEYVKTWVEGTRHNGNLEHVRRTWGWQDDGSCMLGGRLYRPDGQIDPAVISKTLARMVPAFTPKGDLDRYVELIDDLYNRPDRVPHQIIWMSGFASVLARLYDVAPMGLVISAISEISGSGKTSAAQAAMSIWGDPYDARCTASAEGITEFAIYRMAGERKHFPMVLDETTHWPMERLMQFLYRYAQGTPKVQGTSDGGLRDTSDLSWLNILIVTTNASASAKLIAQHGNAAPMLARILEVPFPEEDLRESDKNGTEKIKELLRAHTGIAGHAFLSMITQVDQDAFREQLIKMVAKINNDLDLPSSARYWAQLAAFLLVAAAVTRRMGLHTFDKTQFRDAIYALIRRMKDTVEESDDDIEDIVGAMLSDMNAGLIVTDAPGRLNHRNDSIFLKNLPLGKVRGRVITQGDKAGIYILAKDVRVWCNDHQQDYNTLRDKLTRQGFLLDPGARFNLGIGTPISTGRPRSWRLRYDALQKTAETHLQLVAVNGKTLSELDGEQHDFGPTPVQAKLETETAEHAV